MSKDFKPRAIPVKIKSFRELFRSRRLAGLPIDPLKPPTCPDCGGEAHPGDDQFADAWICGACLKEVSSKATMKMNNDPEWLKKKAAEEDGCDVSVGRLQVIEPSRLAWALNKQLQDEREENYRLRLRIQELEDKLKDAERIEETQEQRFGGAKPR